MQKNRWRQFVAAVVMAWSMSTPAAAVLWTDPPGSFQDVVARADRAYRGRVESIAYGIVPGPAAGQSLPYTRVDLRVEVAQKGTTAGALESIYVLGGPLAAASTRRLLVPGLPMLAVGERAIVFSNHAEFPFTGGVWGATGVLRVVDTGDGAYALTHTWHPLSIANATLVPRADVRCNVDAKRRDRCAGWFPASPKLGVPPKPIPLPAGVARLAQVEAWIAERVRAGGTPATPSLVKPAEVESLIARLMDPRRDK
jgi:hypothetical protein